MEQRLHWPSMEVKASQAELSVDVKVCVAIKDRSKKTLLDVAKAIDAYWSSGNFTRQPDLWSNLKIAIAQAENANGCA